MKIKKSKTKHQNKCQWHIGFKFITEEQDQVSLGLYSILELMNNGMFDIDCETEDEMMECGAISMHTEEMIICLEDAIDFLEKVKKI